MRIAIATGRTEHAPKNHWTWFAPMSRVTNLNTDRRPVNLLLETVSTAGQRSLGPYQTASITCCTAVCWHGASGRPLNLCMFERRFRFRFPTGLRVRSLHIASLGSRRKAHLMGRPGPDYLTSCPPPGDSGTTKIIKVGHRSRQCLFRAGAPASGQH